MSLIFTHWQLEMEPTVEETLQSPFLAITTTATAVDGTLMLVSFDALLLFLVGRQCPLPLFCILSDRFLAVWFWVPQEPMADVQVRGLPADEGHVMTIGVSSAISIPPVFRGAADLR